MTCPDVEQLLGAFVDTELPPQQLLDVARHAATCSACDQVIRDLTDLHAAIATLVEREASHLDLSGVWPRVEATMHLRRPGLARVIPLSGRAAPAARVTAALMAIAASAFFWLRAPSAPHAPAGKRVAAAQSSAALTRLARSFNHADIDRLAGKDIRIGREPKSGTTIIWVNHTVEEGR